MLLSSVLDIIYMTYCPDDASESATGRRASLLAEIVTELKGLNAEFESEEDVALRIVGLVERSR